MCIRAHYTMLYIKVNRYYVRYVGVINCIVPPPPPPSYKTDQLLINQLTIYQLSNHSYILMQNPLQCGGVTVLLCQGELVLNDYDIDQLKRTNVVLFLARVILPGKSKSVLYV